jgi:WD40 repeat protein
MALSEAGNELFTGGIDNDIKVWDLRKQAVTYTLMGHTDTVTSLQLSPDNLSLLSNSHDSTVRTWDIRPFAPADRRIRTYDGALAGNERNLFKASWDTKGERIAAGGGDQNVTIWDVRTGKITNKLPGHLGAVNDVRFSPGDQPMCKSNRFPSLTSTSRILHEFSVFLLCFWAKSSGFLGLKDVEFYRAAPRRERLNRLRLQGSPTHGLRYSMRLFQ